MKPLIIYFNDEKMVKEEHSRFLTKMQQLAKGNSFPVSSIEDFGTIINNLYENRQIFVFIHIMGQALGDKLDEDLHGLTWAISLEQDFPNCNYYFVTSNTTKTSAEIHNKKIAYNINTLMDNIFNKKSMDFQPQTVKEIKSSNSPTSVAYFEETANKFTILTALANDEYEQFRNNMDKIQETPKYFKGTFKKVDGCFNDYTQPFSLIHQDNMGMVEASAFTSRAIIEQKPDVLIMAGVCGGRQSKVKLFDIIIPRQIIEFTTGKLDNGEMKTYDYSSKPESNLFNWVTEPTKLSQIKNKMTALIPSDKKYDKERDIVSKVNFRIESMACVPWVVKTEDFLEKNATKYNEKTQALEMESYGVVRTVEVNSDHLKYCLIVKSVMDYTDTDKQDIVDGVDVKNTAAFISYLCVRAMMPIINDFIEQQKTK